MTDVAKPAADATAPDDAGSANRPVGTALMVVLAICIPPIGVVWGLVRVARGDRAFGAAVATLSLILAVVGVLLAV